MFADVFVPDTILHGETNKKGQNLTRKKQEGQIQCISQIT